MLATDSRWSVYLGSEKLFYFVDDTGFDKMAARHFGAIICAGDALLIQDWRDWFLTPILNLNKLPAVERVNPNGDTESIVISLVYRQETKVAYSFGWYLDHGDEAKFSASS